MATLTALGFTIFSTYSGTGVTAARRDITSLQRDLQRGSSGLNTFTGRMGAMIATAGALGPALIPIGTAAAGVGAATIAMGASAGSALGIFGVAMKGAISSTLALAAAHKQLTPVQTTFVGNVNKMKAAWQQFIRDTQNDTLSVASTAIQGITAGIGKLAPVVRAVTPAIQGVATAFKNWVNDGGLDRFISVIIKNGVPALNHLIAAGRNVLSVLGTGFRAFAPLGVSVAEALERGSRALKGWADGGGFQRFVQTVNQYAPSVKEFFKALGDALKNVGAAMVGLGPLSLGLATSLLKIVAALPPGVIQALVVGFVAFRVAMIAMTIATVAQTVATVALAVASSPFLLLMAGAALTIGLVIAAVAALAVGIYFLVTRWETVKTALVASWNAVWNALKVAAEAVWTFLQQRWNTFINNMILVWTTVSGALTTAWTATWNALKTAAEAVWNALKTAWQAVLTALSTAMTATMNALRTAWTTAWNAIKTAGEAVWNALKTAWQAVLTALQTAATTTLNALRTAWTAAWNAIKTAAEAVWNALKTAFSAFFTAMNAVWNTFKAAFTAAWSAFWNAVKTVANTIWTAIKTAWQAFFTGLNTIYNAFKAAFQAAWTAAWNAVKTAAQSVWDAIKAAWSAFFEAIKSALSSGMDAIKSAWSSAWNTVKEVASDIWGKITDVIQGAVDKIKGIIGTIVGVWNKIAGAVGLDSLKINLAEGGVVGGSRTGGGRFATGGVVGYAQGGEVGATMNFSRGGGVLSGYAPGKDTVPAVLSKGEGVLVPEAVRGLGAGFVHGANYHFSNGRAGSRGAAAAYGFAQGGVAGGSLGGVQAWHRDAPNGWHAAVGGVVPGEIPVPGGGTAGQDPADPEVKDGDDGFKSVVGGAVKNALAGAGMVLGFIGEAAIRALFDGVLGQVTGFNMAGHFGEILKGGTKKLLDGMIEKLVKKDADAKASYTSMSVAGAKSVQAWAPLAAQALAMAGLAPGQLQAFLALMAAESGGNPNAINNWDINATNGVPSQGLMQVIPPTFAAYHVAGTSNNILDPLANMAASASYIKSRYGGSVPGSPYALGTTSATRGWHLVGERGPEMAYFRGGERVDANNRTRTLRRSGGGSGGDVVFEDGCFRIDARGASVEAVKRMETDLVPKLRMAVQAGTGKRG
ncbi:transglycosylase SLT domain-containing protein [Streptomyces sp. NPDC048211]|uniref:transglycosylase SLT domain-containing protein n=1 Tax=Streptomyces sp. NPDC048211 TaxID=3365516 RepID=UPI003715ADEE